MPPRVRVTDIDISTGNSLPSRRKPTPSTRRPSSFPSPVSRYRLSPVSRRSRKRSGDHRLRGLSPDGLLPAPAEVALRLVVPLADSAVLVDGDERLVRGLEDRARFLLRRADGLDQSLDGDAEGAGDQRGDQCPQDLARGVVGAADHDRRQRDHDGHPGDGPEQLRARPVEAEPDQRQRQQPRELRALAAGVVSHQGDDHEDRGRRERLDPGGKPRPGHEVDRRDHGEDEDARRDQVPGLATDPDERRGEVGEHAGRHERRDAPRDARALEGPGRGMVLAPDGRPCAGSDVPKYCLP